MSISINGDAVKLWQTFNCYTFVEDTHTYFYNDKKVRTSVTQFIKRFFPEFDSDNIAERYAKKHGMTKEEVLADWKRKGDISAMTGTAVHSYLENAKRGKILNIDFSGADAAGVGNEVRERFEILRPKAEAFHKDSLGRLFPVQLEYTVGLEDFIAGNIDMLCWNEKAQEFQIWDYKNVKEISQKNNFGEMCKPPFHNYYNCNYIHYSVQLNIYKAILQRVLGVTIGKMYLVHFDYNTPGDNFDIYQCVDFQREVNDELDKYIREVA